MVGMPYPNAKDMELSERMRSLDRHAAGSLSHAGQPSAGQIFYEDLCMKVSSQL